jgi:hypothetical protein
MILQKSAPSLRRRLAAAHHLFADAALTDVDAELEQLTVDPWCTQEEFSRRILRIRCRTSREMIGRPGCPCRTFQVQKRRKPLRCQATTVSGSMIASAERQSLQMRKNQTHNRRSTGVNFRRAVRWTTPIWWPSARFSNWRAARKWKIEDRVAKSVVREIGIGENRKAV